MFNIKEFLGLTYYTSELDQFLKKYDEAHPKLSASQCQEIEKYAHIYALRDNPNLEEPKAGFWEQF
jgi:hypothetical protein